MKISSNILFSLLLIIFLYLIGCPIQSNESKSNTTTTTKITTPTTTNPPKYVSPKNVSVSEAKNQSDGLKKYWYKKSSFYHIWLKSFYDSDGDGCGDFAGVEAKLDYIKDNVGCDAIWLSPCFDCKNKGKNASYNMHGYDTTDFYSVNNYFGTEAQLISLINKCHEKGMKIIFDFVPNHTSTEHQWFKDSVANKNNKRDWYIWANSPNSMNPLGLQNGAWTKPTGSTQYYYGVFDSGMPDLNYRNPEVREEMKNVVRYWLNKGFDGLRIDAAIYLIETGTEGTNTNESHEFYAELRKVIDSYSSPKFMVSESWVTGNRSKLEKYFGTSSAPEFNLVFDFEAGTSILTSVEKNSVQPNSLYGNPSIFPGEGFGIFLANHDFYNNRIGTYFAGDEFGIKIATAMSLLRPTVPFIYYGQEIGMKAPNGGFKKTNNSDMEMRYPFDWDSAASQITNSESILSLNNKLNKLRKDFATTFSDGKINKLTSPEGILAYVISSSSDNILCVFNLTSNSHETISVSGTSLGSATGYSTLIGDTASGSEPVFSTNSVTIKKLAPYAYRAYLLNKSNVANYFDNEIYDGSQHIIDYNPKVSYNKMYFRSSINNWNADSSTEMQSSDGGYTWEKTVSFPAGTCSFKFSIAADWNEGNFGSCNETISSYTDTVINLNGDKNININIPNAGNYKIVFDSHTECVAVLSETQSWETAIENTVYLRGEFSSWDAYKGIAMAKTAENIYSVSFTPEKASTFNFKITKANDNWNVEYGPNNTKLKTSLTIGPENTAYGNLSIIIDKVKTTTFSLNTSTKELTISQ